MTKKLPKVFQNDIGDVDNNVRVFHGKSDNLVSDSDDVQRVIENIFNSLNHVYKTRVSIRTNSGINDYDIIGRTIDSLVTIDNQKIKISDINYIKIKGLD